MHFDQRTQAALRSVGLSTADLQEAAAAVVEATAAEAAALERFFHGREVVYSDMDLAHSTTDYPEHDLEYVDLFTHAADLRGYAKFDGWGAPVEDGRVLSDADGKPDVDDEADAEAAPVVELTLGPTVHDRVRFAAEREQL